MGNGISKQVGTTILTSLNEIFGTNMAATQLKYGMLNTLYPKFMEFTANTSDRHVWRKRTLRHAAFLFTSEVDFNPPHAGHPFPAKNFKKWLRWLTWLHVMPPANSTVRVNGGIVAGKAPADAIMATLKAALEDPAKTPVVFGWSEGAALVVEVVNTGGVYSITVTSIKEPDIPNTTNDNDEDGSI
jgi:hypothetical protein